MMREERQKAAAALDALLPPKSGWIVLCKTMGGDYEPMSYGYGDEPHTDRLAKRGRATLFADRNTAETALNWEHTFAVDANEAWIKRAAFILVPVYADKMPFYGSEDASND